jgi:hypothetical protein
MLNQIFKKQIPKEILFELLEKVCFKTAEYYFIDRNAYKKLIYYKLYAPFAESIAEYYHASKQFYVSRDLTYNSFVNIVRQICKSNGVSILSKQKYNESEYNIDYYIYF